MPTVRKPVLTVLLFVCAVLLVSFGAGAEERGWDLETGVTWTSQDGTAFFDLPVTPFIGVAYRFPLDERVTAEAGISATVLEATARLKTAMALTDRLALTAGFSRSIGFTGDIYYKQALDLGLALKAHPWVAELSWGLFERSVWRLQGAYKNAWKASLSYEVSPRMPAGVSVTWIPDSLPGADEIEVSSFLRWRF